MNKTQKLILAGLVVIILTVVAVVFNKTNESEVPSDQKVELSSKKDSQTKNQTVVDATLQPLPADDKKAIDTELENIEEELKTTDNLINSADLSDANLGL